ncbi:hypothetical protein INT47_010462 [Mucor saturninus]|uniref:Rho-GAP domain-containing protein n=1 Tax=Mucor saturninus TaxID=64648 RepID=A0A8H7V5N4_9FUNG|nr:hypothetical protein INT47_010462 [Mucor saturninus]
MYYSFDFAANITHLCIDEIRFRGLQERKIFKKSLPNSGLLIKVFSKKTFTSEDLRYVHIHSVATLMQAALWSTHDRIISRKAWRTINYQTCTLSSLSSVITSKAEQLLIDILDFLVELMQYKSLNLMDAYNLGDALGKVVLGPADCGPIIQEKAGHFLTRMIIEHAKIYHQKQSQQVIRRIDSGFDYSVSSSCHSFYTEHKPLCKTQGTQARAKFYNRVVSRTRGLDWIDNTIGVQKLLDNDYDYAPEPPEKPWISIFTSTDLLLNPHKDMLASPILYRILKEASKPPEIVSSDPFAASYLFNAAKVFWAERQIREAFTEFIPHQTNTNNLILQDERSNPLKKINHSISHLKLNIKKYRSKHDLLEDSFISEDTIVEEPYTSSNNMKSVMKKMIKLGGVQGKDRKNKIIA